MEALGIRETLGSRDLSVGARQHELIPIGSSQDRVMRSAFPELDFADGWREIPWTRPPREVLGLDERVEHELTTRAQKARHSQASSRKLELGMIFGMHAIALATPTPGARRVPTPRRCRRMRDLPHGSAQRDVANCRAARIRAQVRYPRRAPRATPRARGARGY